MKGRPDTGRPDSAGEVRRKLAGYMLDQAAWRRQRAADEPQSAAAQLRSADAIDAWARYVEGLADDDANLAAIAAGQAAIGSPTRFRPRGDGGAMIRGHGYPNAVDWDERKGAPREGADDATPVSPPNETLMSELARLEGPPRPPGEEAFI